MSDGRWYSMKRGRKVYTGVSAIERVIDGGRAIHMHSGTPHTLSVPPASIGSVWSPSRTELIDR